MLGPHHFLQYGPYQSVKSTLGAAAFFFLASVNMATDGVY